MQAAVSQVEMSSTTLTSEGLFPGVRHLGSPGHRGSDRPTRWPHVGESLTFGEGLGACTVNVANTPAVDRDLVAEAPRTVGRADEIDLRQRGRPFLLRLPESADGGNP